MIARVSNLLGANCMVSGVDEVGFRCWVLGAGCWCKQKLGSATTLRSLGSIGRDHKISSSWNSVSSRDRGKLIIG